MQIAGLASHSAYSNSLRTTDVLARDRNAEIRRIARDPAVVIAGMLAAKGDDKVKEKLAEGVKALIQARDLIRRVHENEQAIDKKLRADKIKQVREQLKNLRMRLAAAEARGDKDELKAIAREARSLAKELRGLVREAKGLDPATPGDADEEEFNAELAGSAGDDAELVDAEAVANAVVGLAAPESATPDVGEQVSAALDGEGEDATMDDQTWRTQLERALAEALAIFKRVKHDLGEPVVDIKA